jgi:hypothetical protein
MVEYVKSKTEIAHSNLDDRVAARYGVSKKKRSQIAPTRASSHNLISDPLPNNRMESLPSLTTKFNALYTQSNNGWLGSSNRLRSYWRGINTLLDTLSCLTIARSANAMKWNRAVRPCATDWAR